MEERWWIGPSSLIILLLLTMLLSATGALAGMGRRLSDRRDAGRSVLPAATEVDLTGSVASNETSASDATSEVDASGVGIDVAAAQPPSAAQAIIDIPTLTTVASLIGGTNLIDNLPIASTLFLPTDDAIAAMPVEALDALKNNPSAMRLFLEHHIAPARISAAEFSKFSAIPTQDGTSIIIRMDDQGSGVLDGANVVEIDAPYKNGLIQVIDRVLFPSTTRAPKIDTPNDAKAVTFKGALLTVVGSAEPNQLIVLHSNGARVGSALSDGDGRWSISADVVPGEYELIAWMLSPTEMLPLGVSPQIDLTVE